MEQEFRLESGTTQKLFKTPAEFIIDLEKNYNRMMTSYFKRHPAPPVPILSRRAFGFDLRESQLTTFFTSRYYDLKSLALSQNISRPRIAVYGGSFNPPCLHHQVIAEKLAAEFDKVIIVPCGDSRSDKDSVKAVSNSDRAIMVNTGFSGLPNSEIDFSDLENNVYTPTYLLEERYANKYPEGEIWHVVGSDLIVGGRDKNSQIQTTWKNGQEVWQNLKFCIIVRPGYELAVNDLPPVSRIYEIPKIYGSGTMVREKIANHEDPDALLDGAIYDYIKAHNLYGY